MGGCMAIIINQPGVQEAPGRADSLAGPHAHPGFCFLVDYGYAENHNAQYNPDWCIIVATCFLQLVISIKFDTASILYSIEVISTPGPIGPGAVQLTSGIRQVGLFRLLSRLHDGGDQCLRTSLSRDRYLEG